MDEMDEVGQELDRALRVTLTGAGQLAERIARRNEEQTRELHRAASEQGRALREQLEGERQAGRLMWRPAVDARWWDVATVRDASRAWQYAAGWAADDPQARAGAGIIREFAAKKWPGRDVDDLLNRSWKPDVAEDVANAAADRQTSRHDRVDAAERGELAHELQDQADAVREDEPDQADALTAEAEGYLADARGLEERASSDPEQSAYSRSNERELVGVGQAARDARLDSAPGFGRPSKDLMKKDQGGKRASNRRARTTTKQRESERGR